MCVMSSKCVRKRKEEQEMPATDDGTSKAAGQPAGKILGATAGSRWVLGIAMVV